jgi:hypothetical protein
MCNGDEIDENPNIGMRLALLNYCFDWFIFMRACFVLYQPLLIREFSRFSRATQMSVS